MTYSDSFFESTGFIYERNHAPNGTLISQVHVTNPLNHVESWHEVTYMCCTLRTAPFGYVV